MATCTAPIVEDEPEPRGPLSLAPVGAARIAAPGLGPAPAREWTRGNSPPGVRLFWPGSGVTGAVLLARLRRGPALAGTPLPPLPTPDGGQRREQAPDAAPCSREPFPPIDPGNAPEELP